MDIMDNDIINKIIKDNNNELESSEYLMKLYNKYKHILSGLNNFEDCEYIINKIHIPEKLKKILLNISQHRKTTNCLGMLNLIHILKPLNNLSSRDDIQQCIDETLMKTNDEIQIKTLNRFLNSKPVKLNTNIHRELNDQYITYSFIYKKCPHCDHLYKTDNKNTSYVICGYENAYDWVGCKRDWCFQCGNKLCKSWDHDDLYLPINRFHNDKCCKKTAKKNKCHYSTEYCQCKDYYVNRNV